MTRSDQERGVATGVLDLEAIKKRWYRDGLVSPGDISRWTSDAADDMDALVTEVARLKAQLAERGAQIATLTEERDYWQLSQEECHNLQVEAQAALEAMRGAGAVEEMAKAMALHGGTAGMAQPEQWDRLGEDFRDAWRKTVKRGLAALDQAQQQQETAQERQQPQQSPDQHSGEPETTDSAEGPEKGLK